MGDNFIKESNNQFIYEFKAMFQNSFDKLLDFLEKQILCDVAIKVGSKFIKCHRIVLASCSPYFQGMFTSSLAESKQFFVTINGIDEAILEVIIKFMYTAKIELSASTVQSLFTAASLLQLDLLLQACCEFLIFQLHPSNCLQIRQLADHLGQLNLVEKSDSYSRCNFREIILTDGFLSISASHLEKLVSSSDLLVNEETEVYEAIVTWVRHNLDERKIMLPKLLSNVRFPFIPVSYVRTCIDTDTLIRNDIECRDLLDEARLFQIWQASRLPISLLPMNHRTRPRKCYAGVIFCVGGRGTNGSPFSSSEFYSLLHNKWFKICDMSTNRRHVGCTSRIGKIYAAGGCDEFKHLSSVEVYDPLTNNWSVLSSLSIARRGLGLCLMEGAIYAVGGLDDNSFFSTVERYDSSSDIWSSVASMNSERGGVAVVHLKGLLYALGGNKGTLSLKTCEAYDPHLDKWTFISSMNECRAGAGAVVLNGCIYIVGGFNNNIPINTVEKYDPDEDSWTSVTPMKFCRGGVGAAVLAGIIFAIGGHDGISYLNTVEMYDEQLDRWEMGVEISDCRAGAGVAWCSMSTEVLEKVHFSNEET